MNRIPKVRKTFNKHSERYESWFSKKEGRLIKETEKNAAEKLIPEGKGLEVGVGSGIFASALGTEYGVDPSRKMLQLARSRGVKTVLGIAERLPFKKRSFDFLLFMFTISFLADPLESFREAYRVLKQDGKLIVCFIPKDSPWGKFYQKKKTEGHAFYRHARFYTSAKVEDLLEKSGFTKTGAVSTLFQKPGSVDDLEEPVEGIHESASLCCFKAIKS